MALGLTPIQQTLFLTLYARALDSRTPQPILDDKWSNDLVRRVDYDFATIKAAPSIVTTTALRGKRLDEAVRAFCATHPSCVVVDLGCGLDPRMNRCGPPDSVDWYSIDYPKVIALRTELLRGGHSIAGDLNEAGWLEALPDDRPAMVVADGVVPFLEATSYQELVRRLTQHFPGGQLALNGYTRFAAWSMRYHPAMKSLGVRGADGFDDPHEPESWGAGLTLVDEDLLARAPEVDSFPQPLRAVTRLMARSTGLSRQGARILRYAF